MTRASAVASRALQKYLFTGRNNFGPRDARSKCEWATGKSLISILSQCIRAIYRVSSRYFRREVGQQAELEFEEVNGSGRAPGDRNSDYVVTEREQALLLRRAREEQPARREGGGGGVFLLLILNSPWDTAVPGRIRTPVREYLTTRARTHPARRIANNNNSLRPRNCACRRRRVSQRLRDRSD